MAKKNLLVSEEQVKNALKIDSFRNLSKDKIMEFVSLIPLRSFNLYSKRFAP